MDFVLYRDAKGLGAQDVSREVLPPNWRRIWCEKYEALRAVGSSTALNHRSYLDD